MCFLLLFYFEVALILNKDLEEKSYFIVIIFKPLFENKKHLLILQS